MLSARRAMTSLGLAMTFLLSCAIAPPPALACSCPTRIDTAAISTAISGVGSPYWWGHAAWDPDDRDWKGADCSGFVIKAWQVPRLSPISEDYHPYGTHHIFNTTYHWYSISRSSAWRADAVGYPDPDGTGSQTGHVVLYERGDAHGNALVLEAPGSGLRIRRAWRDISSSKWRFRRRHQLIRDYGQVLA